jgi:hypothetical protein
MDAFVEEIAFFDREAARADLQELIRLIPNLWVASTQGRSLADVARVDHNTYGPARQSKERGIETLHRKRNVLGWRAVFGYGG